MTASIDPPERESPPAPAQLVKWLSPVEIGFMLGVEQKTVQMWLRDPNHPLVGKKFGTMWRVHPDDFKTFMERQ